MNNNYFSDDYVPGTTNILASSDDSSSNHSGRPLKKTAKGIILLPQPSDSPNDPLNWSVPRKMWHFFIITFITGLTAAISNDAGAAQESLNEAYGISYDAMNTGAGVLFLFIGWSCIFFAPASSLYGRRITYIVCILSGTLGSVWFAMSRRTADTIWSQAFVGMSEACAEAQAQQSLVDIFFQHQLGSVLTVYIMATSIGSFLGPLIAHLIAELLGFRWVGWWGAIICGGTLIVIIFACEETVFDRSKYFPVYDSGEAKDATENESSEDLLHGIDKEDDKTEAVEPEKGDSAEKTEVFEKSRADVENNILNEKNEKPTPYHKRVALITPSSYIEGYGVRQYIKRFVIYFKVFTLPAVWLSGILWGLQDAYMSFFLTTQDTFFYDAPWNYSETGVAVMNVATLVGAVIGCVMSGVISDKHVLWLAKRHNGVYEPEYRLWLLFITMIISPIGLFMFGVGAAKGGEWPAWVVYGGLGFIGFGWGSVGDTAMSYLMDAYPEIVIQGMVGVSIINNTLACIFTFVCSLWLDSAGTQNTYITLAVIDFVSIAFIIPTLYWGKSWRKRTKGLYIELVELSNGMD
ncbi:Major Facilitator Superfamily protein [Metschnikowia aff. pulcherrima]|uniref:Major Facilitator Superfamily protein n=1 Tax=Metschnikowia aff. pulcherrima TaxID=2163413 RepID=A0A4P6XLT1_9ASCO|nr:Major Facilitator Superfamily protein [Metschnikowia aff. pulcherrima]